MKLQREVNKMFSMMVKRKNPNIPIELKKVEVVKGMYVV